MDRKTALQKGLKTYNTGQKCKHGHLSDRYTKSGNCVACVKRRATLWRIHERESYNEYHREYGGKNLRLIEKYLRDPSEVWFEHRSRQRTHLIMATPSWADHGKIRRIYEECLRLSHQFRREFEVVHIIPLRSRNVCGLHVAENLRVASHSFSHGKGNRFNSKKESKEAMKWLRERGLSST